MGDVEIEPLGILKYQRTGWEAPPTPPGYHLRGTEDVWELEPLEPVCKHLELKGAERGSCGYQRIARRCKLVQSFIGQKTCDECQRRE